MSNYFHSKNIIKRKNRIVKRKKNARKNRIVKRKRNASKNRNFRKNLILNKNRAMRKNKARRKNRTDIKFVTLKKMKALTYNLLRNMIMRAFMSLL